MPSEVRGTAGYSAEISGLHALPPHRAAIPVPPVMLAEAFRPRRGFSWRSIMVAVALHCGFLAAALLWGQGEELPPPERAISVELVDRVEPAPAAPPQTTAQDDPPPASPEAQPVAMPAELVPLPAEPAVIAEDGTRLAHDSYAGEPPAFSPPTALRAEPPQTLAAAPAEPDDAPHVIPPLPVAASRSISTAMTTAATAGALPAAFGRRVGAARSKAQGIAAAIYQRRVKSRIQRNVPLGTLGAGRLVVGLRLSRSGRLISAFLLKSSGNAAIDRAAIRCVRTAGPYPPPPPSATPAQRALSVPFRFE